MTAASMETAKAGDFVACNYTGTLESGEVFDTNVGKPGRGPLEFIVGGGTVRKHVPLAPDWS